MWRLPCSHSVASCCKEEASQYSQPGCWRPPSMVGGLRCHRISRGISSVLNEGKVLTTVGERLLFSKIIKGFWRRDSQRCNTGDMSIVEFKIFFNFTSPVKGTGKLLDAAFTASNCSPISSRTRCAAQFDAAPLGHQVYTTKESNQAVLKGINVTHSLG